MGCASSVSDHPSIYNETQRQKGLTNGHVKPEKPPKCVNENSLRGDYSQFILAKHNREKHQKDRQIKIFMAADEMSGKMIEEREMLSLGTRSRGTSKNTSRATSPNNNKRSVQFKDEQINPMTPVAEDKLSRGASLRSFENETASSDKENLIRSPKKKQKTKKQAKAKSKGKKHKKGKKSKKGKDKALKEIQESENDEPDSGLEDENEDIDDENINSVKGESIDEDADLDKSEHEVGRNKENVEHAHKTPNTAGASTSVILKGSVNDIAIHSASDDSGIAGNGADDVTRDTFSERGIMNKADTEPNL